MLNKNVTPWIDITKLLNLFIIFFAIMGVSILLIIILNPVYDNFERILFFTIPLSAFIFVLILVGLKMKFKHMSQRNIGITLDKGKDLIIKLFNEKNIGYTLELNQRGIILPIPFKIKSSNFEIRLINNGELHQLIVYSYKGLYEDHKNILMILNQIFDVKKYHNEL